MRGLLIMVVTGACTPWTKLPDVAGPGDVSAVSEGLYQGAATLEVRAYSGPLMLKRELCNVPIDVVVDESNPSLLQGEFSCEFDSLGEVYADFTGDLDGALPLIAGTLDARSLEADWYGWFIDSGSLYADMQGTDRQQGLRLEYIGFVQAERTGPLPGSNMGM